MSAMLGGHFFGPVPAVRPLLFTRLLYLLLAVDVWLHFVGRGVLYGADGFNVAHFHWLDALGPMPTAALYTGMMVLISFASFAVALMGPHRPLMMLVCVLFTYAWSMSQLDNYQHHYFLSLLLFLSLFLPKVSPADAVGAKPPSGPLKPAHEMITAWAFPLIGVQIAILYFYAAISKMDSRWVAGSVMGNLSSAGEGPSTAAVPLLGPMLGDRVWPLLAVGAIVGEIILVAGYVLSLRRDRAASRFWAGAMWLCWLIAMGLHAGIEWFHLRIGLFSYYMMALACVFFLPVGMLMPAANAMATLSARISRMLHAGSAQRTVWIAWILVAIGVAAALPVVIIGLDVPGTSAGLIVTALLFAALFLHAAVNRNRVLACGFVLVTALYLTLVAGYILTSNLRSDMHLALAEFSHRAGQHDAAMARYETAQRYRLKSSGLEEDQFQARLALNMGDVHQSAGRTVEAAAKYQEAMTRDPKSVMARMNLASLHLAKGRKIEAAELLVQVIELEPGNAGARYNMGVILMESKRIAPAITQFEAAVAADPTLLEAQNNLAAAYILTKNHAAAVKPLREILKHAPDSVDALNNLAIILCTNTDPKVRQLEEAIVLAQRAVKLTGRKEVDILATLARTLSAAGRDTDAQAVLDEMAALRKR